MHDTAIHHASSYIRICFLLVPRSQPIRFGNTAINIRMQELDLTLNFTACMMENTWTSIKEALPCSTYITTKAAILVKKLLSNMTSCSQESQALQSAVRRELETALPPTHPRGDRLLDCSSCEGFMAQPVCLPCGHSVCKCCLYKLRSSFTLSSILCPQCKHTCPQNLQDNRMIASHAGATECLPEVVP